jgi:tRNA-uridine 2-sulfurtransferase
MSKIKEKVVIAMSGGVDSSVCAAMMKDEGFDCVGMTMRLWKGPEAEAMSCSSKSCCGAESVEDARLVAETVGIPYYAINFKEEFWSEVVEVFAEEYFAGRTPSPCILCNEKLKFSTLFQKALDIGASKVCTGHYAKITFDKGSGRWNLERGFDRSKDQSYFLFSMTQDQLSKTLFPLGGFTKPQIREMAGAKELVNANKPESMDICFIPDGKYASFLERHFKTKIPKKGEIHDLEGNILGAHSGIHNFTIGQRKGLGVSSSEPLYVQKIDPETSVVTLAPKEACLFSRCSLERMNWISHDLKPGQSVEATVKIRSRGKEALCTVKAQENGTAELIFSEKQLAVTPGQAAVFYLGEKVLGGGWIERAYA